MEDSTASFQTFTERNKFSAGYLAGPNNDQ